MFSVIVEAGFTAIHQVRLHDGTIEPRHGHDWRVQATFTRPALDEQGMVVDFAEARRMLHQALALLDYKDLNQLPAFREENPTTEVVARWIFRRMFDAGATTLVEVEVTEAPGCRAIFRRDPRTAGCTGADPIDDKTQDA